MAKTKTFAPLMPWEDRWQQPQIEALLKPIKDPQIKPFRALMERLEAFEHVEHELQWQGLSWKWTLVYTHALARQQKHHAGLQQFAYLIPRPGSVSICVPLTTDFIYALPMRRLNRYIRDGIRVAKCAVDIHWATWTPMAMTEVEHLHDLLKRKDRFIQGEQKQQQQDAGDDDAESPESASADAVSAPPASKSSRSKKSKKTTAKTTAKAAASKKTTKKSTPAKRTKKTTKTTRKSTTSSKTTKKTSSSTARSKKKK